MIASGTAPTAERERIKTDVCAAIDTARDEIFAFTNRILSAPELGYKEVRTAELVASALGALGLEVRTGLARTGVKAWAVGTPPRPAIAIMGELDALPVPSHPHADPTTGAAHACGHHAQIGMLLAAATGLVRSGALARLAGRVTFLAAPAEESVEIEWRLELRAREEIEFLGGKQELVRIGAFDDVDMAIITHSAALAAPIRVSSGGSSNGHLMKWARFIGRPAHAGAAPFAGVNALKAATIALAAMDAQRETYRDEDSVRVHAIITRGGDVVNAVPGDVRLEAGVRAKRIEALQDAASKVDRALRAGALAMGAKAEVTTLPGYLPLIQDATLRRIFAANAAALVGPEAVGQGTHGGYTTDVGDLSHILPTLHPNAAGATGRSHGADFLVEDLETGVIVPAKAMAMTAVDLLADGAREATALLTGYRPRMRRDEYLALLRGLSSVDAYGELAGPTP